MLNFKNFDYETKRAIYSECQAVKCPNLEVEFIKEFLKRDYAVLFVTINQPYSKIKKAFGDVRTYPKLRFIDCVSATVGETHLEENVRYIEGDALEDIYQGISSEWDRIDGKRLLFFDCAELLVTKFDNNHVFNFVHMVVQKLQKDGIAVFCFLQETMEKGQEVKIRHLFDQSIYL